jgi:hypothetical protein
VLFPVTLFLVCTLYLPSRGMYQDDYSYGMRDPVTGKIDWSQGTFDLYPFFFRPLGFVVVRWVPTIVWHHWWMYHVLSALTHGAVALGLWRVMRRQGLGPHASAAGALLFLTFPMHYEVTLWATSISIAMAAGVFVWLVSLWIDWARGRRAWWTWPLMIAVAFAIPCFYEQPGAGIMALPLLYLAVCPRTEPWRKRILRAGGGGFALGLTQVVYVLLLTGTAPSSYRGASGSLVRSVGEAADRAHSVVHDVIFGVFGTRLMHTLHGAFSEGVSTLGSARGLATAVVLGAALWAWFGWWMSSPWTRPARAPAAQDEQTEVGADPAWSAPWALLFGLALAVCAWVPMMLVRNQIAEPRMSYFGMFGVSWTVAVALAVVGAGAARIWVSGPFKLAAGGALVICVLYGVVCCVGWQAVLASRSRADRSQAEQIRLLMPRLPPAALIVPLVDDYMPARTGQSLVDNALNGWLRRTWIGSPLLQQTYRRRDVFALENNPWQREAEFSSFTTSGFRSLVHAYRYEPSLVQGHPDGGYEISWARAVPFVVDRAGEVKLVERIRVKRSGGDERVVDVPLVIGSDVPRDRRTEYFVVEPDGGPRP